MTDKRTTPRDKRIEDQSKAAERQRERERRVEQNRQANDAKEASKWKPEYNANRKKKAIEKAAAALKKLQGGNTGPKIVYQRAIESAEVSSPRVAGATDFVKRAVDTIEKMRKRKGAGGIDKTLYRVAQEVKTAFDTLHGSIGGVMDFDRVRGGGGVGITPSEAELVAGRKMSEIQKALDANDYELLFKVILYGVTIDEHVAQRFGVDPKTHKVRHDDRVYAERRLIDALKTLAALWYPAPKESAGRGKRESIVTWTAPAPSEAS